MEEQDGTYLGYERWLPSPPKVEKPRSVFNAASLAYIGDCIYEVHFFVPAIFTIELCLFLLSSDQHMVVSWTFLFLI